jgi:poly-gamma-glutamate capsule biosynthesis protein CapA/YwtB (metallophosphatase superfamily)
MQADPVPDRAGIVTLFLSGDVMTGRGIDQILPHPSDPVLYEPYVSSARTYVELAEQHSGPLPAPVAASWIWGDALDEWARVAPDLRIVNLETAVTTSAAHWPGKGIQYRMHPDNIACLTAAGIDCCVLANNHVMDWGADGLVETLEVLDRAGLKHAGAGRHRREARAPAIAEIPGQGRVLLFAWGLESSGVPREWAAAKERPGVNLLPDLSRATLRAIAADVREVRRAGDLAVASLHWGANWGYHIPRDHRTFAHRLIDEAGIDIVYGHSSHHALPVEVHNGRPILYGCGDFVNDYEGIGGYEQFRGELALMYFLRCDMTSGETVDLRMTPMKLARFRLNRASPQDAQWLADTLSREGAAFGSRVRRCDDGRLILDWR